MYRYWTFVFPALLMGLELGLHHLHPYFFRYYPVALRDQPVLVLSQFFWTGLRIYSAYLIFALVLDRVFFFLRIRWRMAGYLLVYLGCSLWMRSLYPSLNDPLRVPILVFVLSVVAAGLFLPRYVSKARPPVKGILGVLVIAVAVVWSGKGEIWQTHPSAQESRPVARPSFFLLSWDSIPGAFYGPPWDEKAAPQFKEKWKQQSHVYRNAYAVSNSTRTSWFSILSGYYPFRSGIQHLLPNEKAQRIPNDELLPRRLQSMGYETSYLTDCSSTFFAEKKFGFNRLYQQGRGMIDCGRTLLLSKHAFLPFFGAKLFPELNTFCSYVYDPNAFFSEVQKELRRLKQGKRPYFLAVHSCLPHRTSVKHSPPHTESLEPLPDYVRAVRWADEWSDKLLTTAQEGRSQPWSYVFADHGSRFLFHEEEPIYFSHAWGHPISRYQYHVPLYVVPPKGVTVPKTKETVVSLMDLYPTLLHQAGNEEVISDGRDLGNVKTTGQRTLFLSSSLPIEMEESKFIEWLQEKSRVNEEGIFRFSTELEAELEKRASVALLNFPYRLVAYADGEVSLYHELNDPHSQTDIKLKNKKKAQALFQEMCREFPGKTCDGGTRVSRK